MWKIIVDDRYFLKVGVFRIRRYVSLFFIEMLLYIFLVMLVVKVRLWRIGIVSFGFRFCV